jgi:hypothetical protein
MKLVVVATSSIGALAGALTMLVGVGRPKRRIQVSV